MRIPLAIVPLACVLALSGCSGAMLAPSNSSSALKGASIHGAVHGGQQAIQNARVYLYAVNTTGLGSSSISLLVSADNTTEDSDGNYYVTTDSTGSFSIDGDYTCPASTSQVYLYSLGGNPGGGTANPNAGLLAGLGTCPAGGTLSSSIYATLDEVSTIATAYALAGFASDATHISSSSSTQSQLGAANAFLTMTNLENLTTGATAANTQGGNGTIPVSEINTLANILSACVNSVALGGVTSYQCSYLFAETTTVGITPSDTATAAIHMAQNPSVNVGTLFSLAAPSSPFEPALTKAPNDFTVALSYTGGSVNSPRGIAVDGSGNIWVSNYGNNSVSEFSNLGASNGNSPITGNGLNGPVGIAVDITGNIWVANTKGDSLSEFTPSGGAANNSPFSGGGLSSPAWIAFDTTGNLWATNGDSVSEFSSTGGAESPANTGDTAGGIDVPRGIALDMNGDVWIANETGNSVSELNPDGTPAGSAFTVGVLDEPYGVAIDLNSDVWVSNYGNNTITELTSSGTVGGDSPYSGGGLDQPQGIAVDGFGNVWVANVGGNSLSEFNNGGQPITGSGGYAGGGLAGPYSLAIDFSGNIWAANSSGSVLTEFVGVAGPVVTPVVASLSNTLSVTHGIHRP